MTFGLSRKSGLALSVVGAALVVAMFTGWWVARHASESAPLGAALPDPYQRPVEKAMAHLYFADHQGEYLIAEQRVMEKPVDKASWGQLLIESLIAGPTQGASPTIPGDARLDALFITPAEVAYLDFAAGSFSNHPGGAGAELLSIYSIVNTLVLNVDGIRSVKFLIGGREAVTLAGHSDLRFPFEVDMMWIR